MVKFRFVQEYMDLTDIALLWGVDPATLRKYHQQGRLPKEDAKTGLREDGKPRYGWLRETVATFERPGQGARTDLQKNGPRLPLVSGPRGQHSRG